MSGNDERGGVAARLRACGLLPRKGLGQHFLFDPAILSSIVAAAGVGSSDRVFEVGAGAGTLTRALAARAGEVLSVEIDPRMLAFARRELAGYSNVRLLEGDVLGARGRICPEVAAELQGLEPFLWVSNLPYRVAARLMVAVCESRLVWTRAALTVQAEVAGRVIARAGDRAYGPVSALVAYWAKARGGRRIPPGAFWPPPRVVSRVLLLQRREPLGDPQEYPAYRKWVKRLFGQRRKQLQGLLREAAGPRGAEVILERTGWDPTRRPASLQPADFLRLARLAP